MVEMLCAICMLLAIQKVLSLPHNVEGHDVVDRRHPASSAPFSMPSMSFPDIHPSTPNLSFSKVAPSPPSLSFSKVSVSTPNLDKIHTSTKSSAPISTSSQHAIASQSGVGAVGGVQQDMESTPTESAPSSKEESFISGQYTTVRTTIIETIYGPRPSSGGPVQSVSATPQTSQPLPITTSSPSLGGIVSASPQPPGSRSSIAPKPPISAPVTTTSRAPGTSSGGLPASGSEYLSSILSSIIAANPSLLGPSSKNNGTKQASPTSKAQTNSGPAGPVTQTQPAATQPSGGNGPSVTQKSGEKSPTSSSGGLLGGLVSTILGGGSTPTAQPSGGSGTQAPGRPTSSASSGGLLGGLLSPILGGGSSPTSQPSGGTNPVPTTKQG